MKIRTVYFKVAEMAPAVAFWQVFLGIVPHKNGADWVEFRVGSLNFALLAMPGFTVAKDASNFVPVFEYADDELDGAKMRALELGATHVIDTPDGMSYVLADPLGNEFEITRMHE